MSRSRRPQRSAASRSGRVTWVRASEARAQKSVRGAGDRAWLSFERKSQRRGERARSHLDRMRSRGGRSRPRHPQIMMGVAFALSLAAGSLLAGPVLGTLQRRWAAEPQELVAISVQGNRRLDAGSVAAATGVAKGSPFEAVRSQEVEAALLAHPWIRSAEALRLPTGELLVSIDEREPRAVLYTEQGSDAHWQVVDASGTPFAPAEPADVLALPRLRGTGAAPRTGSESPQLARGVAVLESLAQLAARDTASGAALFGAELTLPDAKSSRGWVLRTSETQRDVILGEQALDQRLAHLALLLDTGPEALEAAQEIDLRFADRAVLRSSSTSR